MAVKFYTEGHRYESVDIFDSIKWYSASKIPSLFKKKFDAEETAKKVSVNKKSKWYGLPPQTVLDIWQAENLRAITSGTWYHEQEEKELLSYKSLNYKGFELPIIPPVWENACKVAQNQKLTDGIYPELLVYLLSAGTCGQFDRVNVYNKTVDIDDHKTNKDLKKPAFINWEGISEKFLSPLAHLEATKLNEYALQLSIGMYMILRHNPLLKPGKQTLNYVSFEVESEDEYGYPILKLENGKPIVKEIEKIEVPYMKREVELMFDFIKNNLR